MRCVRATRWASALAISGTVRARPCSSCQDDLGLEQIAVAGEQLAARHGEAERAQDVEALERFAEVGVHLLDHDAFGGEAHRGLPGDGGDLGLDRGDAEIGRVGDLARPPARAGGGGEGLGRRRHGERIFGVLAGHRIEQQGEVIDVARHRSVDAKRAVDLAAGRGGDAADAGT